MKKFFFSKEEQDEYSYRPILFILDPYVLMEIIYDQIEKLN